MRVNVQSVKAGRAVKLTSVEMFFRLAGQFVVSVLLARILSPGDFGIVASVYIFTSIGSALVDGGLSLALIQNKEASWLDESTVFWLNLIFGFVVCAALWGGAGFIAGFYGVDVLSPVVKILSINILVASFGAVQGALLIKKVRSKALMVIGSLSAIVSGVLAVCLALNGFGVWAIVFQPVCASCVNTALFWCASDWRPGFVFSFKSAKKMFRFGGYMLVSTIIDNLYGRLSSAVLGKFYGMDLLGVFNRAESTSNLVSQVINPVLSRVAFPMFSLMANDHDLLKSGLKKAIVVSMAINIPALLGLIAVADPLVRMLFGEKWVSSVCLIQILCVSALFWPLHLLNLNFLMAKGFSKQFFVLDVVKKIIGAGGVFVGLNWGLEGVAWSLVAVSVFSFFVNTWHTKIILDYGPFRQLWEIRYVLFAGFLMFFVVCVVGFLVPFGPFFKVLVMSVVGCLFYVLCVYFFDNDLLVFRGGG